MRTGSSARAGPAKTMDGIAMQHAIAAEIRVRKTIPRSLTFFRDAFFVARDIGLMPSPQTDRSRGR
jgi:hypothetical protein